MARTSHFRGLVAAAVAAGILPAALAAILVYLVPTGCDIRGDPVTYRWTCLFPGLLVSAGIASALILPVLTALYRRWRRPHLPHWFLLALLTGLATQAFLMVAYAIALDPVYRRLFYWEALGIPQPFAAGVVAGAAFFAVLSLSNRRS